MKYKLEFSHLPAAGRTEPIDFQINNFTVLSVVDV